MPGTLPTSTAKKISLRTFWIASLVLLSMSFSVAQDREGSKDSPLLSRYPGSVIRDYSQSEFSEYDLVLGKLKSQGGNIAPEKAQHLEGKTTNILYRDPEHRSLLEVYRNYEQALSKAGFQTLYACRNELCGGSHDWLGKDVGRMFFEQSWPQGHLSAKLARPEGDVYASFHACTQTDNGQGFDYVLTLVEMKPMESGLVTVDAAALAGDIARTGHASVYGIYFDTGKADVKSESEVALKEISKLLQQDPKMKLYVVGHTDNQGGLEMNMDLSMRRANAVVQALSSKYGVAVARLKALGDGPSAPVASNDMEDGRSKNRRVELVKQ